MRAIEKREIGKRGSVRKFFLAALAICACSSLSATVLYSTVGSGDADDRSGWRGAAPETTGPGAGASSSFLGSSAGDRFAVRPASFLAGGTDAVTLEMAADASGAPGAVLESLTLSPAAPASVLTATSVSNPLSSASDDPIAMLAGTEPPAGEWNQASLDQLGAPISIDGGSPLAISSASDALAFDLSGENLPEVASSVLLLGAVGAFGLFRPRRRA